MSDLTDEEKRLIEMKRQKAMAIRDAKRQKSETPHPVPSASPFATKSALSSVSSAAASSSSKSTASSSSTKSPYFSSNGQTRPVTTAASTNSKASQNGSSNANAQSKPNGQNQAAGVKKKILISLMSSSRLAVTFSYDKSLIDQVRKVRSASYDPQTKKWDVALDDYKNLIDLLKQLDGTGIVLDADSVPARVVSFILSEKREDPVNLSERLSEKFISSLFPFQREGIKFAIRRNGRCIVADDMGLGKTVQALGVACWFKNDWPLIIVCPASVTRTWQEAILKWFDFVTAADIEIADSPAHFPTTRIIIMSYERLIRCTEDVIRRKANFVIFDESHSIKSGDSQRTRSALSVAKAAKRVILLSGTPALSRPMELYTQMFAINCKVFPNKHEFGLRYCNAKFRIMGRGKQIWDYKGSSNSDELRILLESTIMIRRLKKDVLQDLPQKNRVIVNLTVDLTSEEEKMNEDFHNRLSGQMNRMNEDKRKELMEWYNNSAAIKAPAVISYLKEKLKRVQKLICFAHHKVMIEAMCEYLEQEKISFVVITGATPAKVRQDCCNVFQSNNEVRLAVVSIMAAGVGITLTAAHQVVFAELSWNPGILIQAEDRAHRIGQEEKVVVEYLLAKGTVDDVIWPMIARKLNVLNKVGLSADSMSGAASRDKNQTVIEDYFSKAKIKVEPDESSSDSNENALSNLMEDIVTEEDPAIKFDGLVCSQGSALPVSSTAATALVRSPSDVVTLNGGNSDEEFFFDDDDDDLFLVT